jgi:hypothetical protein
MDLDRDRCAIVPEKAWGAPAAREPNSTALVSLISTIYQFSPEQFSPEQFSPEQFSPEQFSPNVPGARARSQHQYHEDRMIPLPGILSGSPISIWVW